MTLFAALSAGAKTYLLCNISIFLFSAFTERLGGCLYISGLVVKFSILMSTMLKNSFFPVVKDMQSDAFLLYKYYIKIIKRHPQEQAVLRSVKGLKESLLTTRRDEDKDQITSEKVW